MTELLIYLLIAPIFCILGLMSKQNSRDYQKSKESFRYKIDNNYLYLNDEIIINLIEVKEILTDVIQTTEFIKGDYARSSHWDRVYNLYLIFINEEMNEIDRFNLNEVIIEDIKNFIKEIKTINPNIEIKDVARIL